MKSLPAVIIASLLAVMAMTAKDFDARANYYRSQINNPAITPADKLPFYDPLIATHPADSALLYYYKGNALRLTGDMQNAMLAYLKAYQCRNELTQKDAFEVAYCVANMDKFFGYIPDAIRIAREMTSAEKPDSLRYYDVKAQLILINSSLAVNDFEEAERSCSKGIKLLEKWRRAIGSEAYNRLAGAIYMANGALLSNRQKWEEAYSSLMKAAEADTSLTRSAGYNLSMGNFYSSQNEFMFADKYYRLATTDTDDTDNRLSAVINCALNLVDRKDYSGALEWLKSNDSLIAANGFDKNSRYASTLSEIYEGLGDYRTALACKRRADSLEKQMLDPAVLTRIDSVMQQIRRDDIEAAVGSPAAQRRLWGILAAVVATAIAAVVIMSLRIRRKNTVIAAMTRDGEDSRALIDNLRDELADSSQQLSTSAARMAQINDSLASLRELASNPRSRKDQLLESINSAMRSLAAGSQVWEPFMEYMQGVNQGFLDKLYRLHPDLTNSEIRMCAFILLNRTTKEIAQILNRSPRTVESLKYSLRRKMNLREIPTEAYLRLISSTPADRLDDIAAR